MSPQPVSEYGTFPIFSNAYPWLFPGGYGDIDERNLSERGYVNKWLRTLILYYDGRFTKDATFCFCAFNFKHRHQNSASGKIFIEGFMTANKPSDLESLKKDISNSHYDLIEKIIYYSSKINGSSSYWRSKRYEVFSWINRSVVLGKGPPTLFITLSCAEHFWPDVKRRLRDRISFMDECDKPNLDSKADILKAIKEYSIVVEEFFIKRVQSWMETFGKEVFKITIYFVRFEFTEGRGEIHAHTLCVADNKTVYEQEYQSREDVGKKKSIFANYAATILGLTSQHPCSDDNGDLLLHQVLEPEGFLQSQVVYSFNYCPCRKRLNDVTCFNDDDSKLINSVQMHRCGDYCMRTGSNNIRYCRVGCGKEKPASKNDTPGFQTSKEVKLSRDHNGIMKLCIPRNTKRMVQSSLKRFRLWRANCDVQMILYMSDPNNPDMYELSKVPDYVVSYACKGNLSTESEMKIILTLVQR